MSSRLSCPRATVSQVTRTVCKSSDTRSWVSQTTVELNYLYLAIIVLMKLPGNAATGLNLVEMLYHSLINPRAVSTPAVLGNGSVFPRSIRHPMLPVVSPVSPLGA